MHGLCHALSSASSRVRLEYLAGLHVISSVAFLAVQVMCYHKAVCLFCHAQAGLALAFTSEEGSQPGSISVAATISGRVIGR